MEYNCPNCGAPLHFQSKVSIYTTCKFCRSNVVRRDMDLEKIGEVSELLDDMSPFQVGTQGLYEGVGFRLLGRIKVGYKGGMWSEWYALMEDGREAWLAEAQGNYMMSFPVANPKIPDQQAFKLGENWPLQGRSFQVEDKRSIRYLASEGELPFVFQQNFQGYSIDLRGQNGKFLSILMGPQGKEAFLGRYVDFDEFNFQYLRQIDGWN